MTTNILLKVVRYGTYAALFTPLVVAPWFVYPFVLPKAIFFWVITEIIFVAWVYLAMSDRRFRPQENVVLYAVGGFLLILLLASFRGVNIGLSFWSTFERMGGMITLIHGFLFFLVLSSSFHTLREWKKFFLVSVFVGSIVSLVFFLDENLLNFLPNTRVGSTLGNSSFFGAYVIFPIFFAIFLFLRERVSWKKVFLFGSGILMILSLMLANAWGAFVALLGGIFLVFVAWLFFEQTLKTRITNNRHAIFHIKSTAIKISWTFVSLCTVLGVVVFYGVLTQDERIMKYVPASSIFSDSAIGARRVVWEGAWKGIQERPILGWGVENFRAPYAKYYNPCMPIGEECGGEVWFDHAHNIVLDTLVDAGLAGLISYLLVFVSAMYLLWKKVWRSYRQPLKGPGPNSAKWLLPSVFSALLAVYFVQNLFVFDMPASYLMFFLTLAFISRKSSRVALSNSPIYKEAKLRKTGIFFCGILILVLGMSIFFFGYKSLQAANFTYRSLHTRLPIEERMRLYTASLKATPLGNEQSRQSFTNTMIGWVQGEHVFSQEIMARVEKEAEAMLADNPYSLRSYLILGNFYNAMAKARVVKHDDIPGAKRYITKAKRVLEKAIILSPTNQKGYLSLSQAYIFERNYAKAEELLQAAIDLEPRYADSYWNLGEVYMFAKDFEKSAKKYDEALALGYGLSDDLRKLANLGRSYSEAGQYKKAVLWYERVVDAKPGDAEARWTLATFYKELGEYEKAKEQAEIVKELDAKYEGTVDKFIKGLE